MVLTEKGTLTQKHGGRGCVSFAVFVDLENIAENFNCFFKKLIL